MPQIRLALAQINPVLGDLPGNAERMLAWAHRAHDAGAELLVFPEMALSGYPIEDLAGRADFLAANRAGAEQFAVALEEAGLGSLPVLFGHADGPFPPRQLDTSNAPTAIAQNVASLVQHGRVLGRYAKHHLPNYSVFDEYRVFIPGDGLLVIRLKEAELAVIICEDLWRDSGPVARLAESGAGALLVLNGSPFERDKDEVRLPLVTRRAVENGLSVAYVNLVGGQDDLVFDGDSVIVDSAGRIRARAPQFAEHLLLHDLELPEAALPRPEVAAVQRVEVADAAPGQARSAPLPADLAELPDDREQLWQALVLGLRDYVEKNRFRSVALGLSGGIDSAVCATLAVDALGADRVHGVSMPSRYSSDHSRSDADVLAANLGLHYSTEPIAELVSPFEAQLALTGVAAENLQARVRALILMGLSNQHGHLVLTTGNKTEISVGYSTIYGDSAGGFAPIKDVPKTLVWELARWRNAQALARGEQPPIPENSITKPPSAELRPDQTDQDSLPPYDVLDALLEGYIAQQRSRAELVEEGFDAAVVDEVIRLVDRSEWKRRQGAIGPKISGYAFGRDRRLPITYQPG